MLLREFNERHKDKMTRLKNYKDAQVCLAGLILACSLGLIKKEVKEAPGYVDAHCGLGYELATILNILQGICVGTNNSGNSHHKWKWKQNCCNKSEQVGKTALLDEEERNKTINVTFKETKMCTETKKCTTNNDDMFLCGYYCKDTSNYNLDDADSVTSYQNTI